MDPQVRLHGVQRYLGLGNYPAVGLLDARHRALDPRKQIADAIDPLAARRTGEARKRGSFARVAEDWLAHKAKGWAPATTAKVRFYLHKDLLPRLGARPIADLSRCDLLDLLGRIERRGAYDAAKKCRQYLGGIFRHALGQVCISDHRSRSFQTIVAGISAGS